MIKTYPLRFTQEELNKIKIAAIHQNKTIKDFILDAIKKEMGE